MTTDQFRAMLRQQPVRTFTIRTAGGGSFTVTHLDFVAQSPSGRTVVVVIVLAGAGPNPFAG